MEENPTHDPRNERILSEVCALIARVSLGVWFVYSGGVKIFGSGLDRFTYDISNYHLVPEPWDAVIAYALPWLELIGGLCLMLGILRRGALLATGMMVVVFSIAVAWAWVHQLDISCGCQGGDGPIHYWGKMAELSGYFVLLGWLWWMEMKGRGELPMPA